MERQTRTTKDVIALAGLLVALCTAVTAAPFLGAADAKKKKSLVGKYKGTSEEGGSVSFRLTRSAKIVGLTLTNATLYCHTSLPTEDFPTDSPDYTKTVTITHGPIPMRGVSKKNPQGKKFRVSDPAPENAARQDGVFTGKVTDLTSTPTGGAVVGKGFHGEVTYETANGPTPFPSSQNPTPVWAPGTEWCVTRQIDWDAKKPGAPGFVPQPLVH